MAITRAIPAMATAVAACHLHKRIQYTGWGLACADGTATPLRREVSRKLSGPYDFRGGAFQRYDEELSKIGRALRPGIATARYTPDQTEVIRVVLTGGPCAGKSSALTHLVENATAAGYDVYRMPEIATILLNSGCHMPNPNSSQFEEQLFVFQQQIICFQLQAERSFLKIAGKTGRPSIVIYDRGLLDSKAYMPDNDAWKTLLHSVEASSPDLSHERKHMTEEYILGRYDLVVHLVTAADGASEHYKSGEVVDDSGAAVMRGESLEQAVALDRKLQQVWSVHKRHVIIGNGARGFKEKIERCTQAIVEVAGEIQPQPFHRRIRKLEDENATLRAQLKQLKASTA